MTSLDAGTRLVTIGSICRDTEQERQRTSFAKGGHRSHTRLSRASYPRLQPSPSRGGHPLRGSDSFDCTYRRRQLPQMPAQYKISDMGYIRHHQGPLHCAGAIVYSSCQSVCRRRPATETPLNGASIRPGTKDAVVLWINVSHLPLCRGDDSLFSTSGQSLLDHILDARDIASQTPHSSDIAFTRFNKPPRSSSSVQISHHRPGYHKISSQYTES